MIHENVQAALADLPLGGFLFYKTIGSTNDEALAWCGRGAQDLSLVIADEQTAGRGRSGRKWFTPAGTALAFSLILRPSRIEHEQPARITGMGALAVVDALRALGLEPQIKWPNDVLINNRKVAGILVESVWHGNTLDAVIIGMGINVLAGSLPPASDLLFPATTIETELKIPVDRSDLLHGVISSLLTWRPLLGSDRFLQSWEDALAYRGKIVQVQKDQEAPINGKLAGLDRDGGLRLEGSDKSLTIHFGEIHLRPMDDTIR